MRKKILTLVLALVMLMGAMPLSASAAFSMRTTASSSDNKYYYDSSYNPFYTNLQGQCTWYAWGRAYEITGKRPTWSPRGDADVWYSNAKSAGYPTGTTPKVAAIACWDNWKHVAVVEEIKNGNPVCSQANRMGNSFYYETMTTNTKRYDIDKNGTVVGLPDHYIYLLDDSSGSSTASTTPATKTAVTFSSLSVPSSLVEGTDATLDGSITATNSKINGVTANVINTATGSIVLSAYTGGNFSVWTYGPIKGSKLDSDLNLGKLPAGTYYVSYIVTTQDGTTASKSTSNFTVNAKACTTHTWGNWTTTTAVTCTAAGSRTHSCTKCGKSESEPIFALGHNYSLTSSTATKDIYTCSNCGDSYSKEKKPNCSDGHTWGDWVTLKPATCTEDGLERHVCKLCGFAQKSDISMLGHNYQATQETDAYIRYTCSNCKNSYTVDKDPVCETVGHTWGEWIVIHPATCTSAGRQEHTCTVCGKTESGLLAYLHHNYELTRSTSTQDVYTCSLCEDSYTKNKEIIDDADYFNTSVTNSSGMANFAASYYYYNDLFSDVSYFNWFYPNVKTAYELGLMKGTGAGTFSPGNNMTLAEVVTLAARIHKIYYTGNDNFPVYDGGNWYDPYVDYARENSIVNTYYDYTRPATREQFVHILARALPENELENTAGQVSFADSGEIIYMADVRLLSGAGVINGISENSQTYFKPRNAITRAEVAAVVSRMVNLETRLGSKNALNSSFSYISSEKKNSQELFGTYISESERYSVSFQENGRCEWYQDGLTFYGAYSNAGADWCLSLTGHSGYVNTIFYAQKVDNKTIIVNGGTVQKEIFTKS